MGRGSSYSLAECMVDVHVGGWDGWAQVNILPVIFTQESDFVCFILFKFHFFKSILKVTSVTTHCHRARAAIGIV